MLHTRSTAGPRRCAALDGCAWGGTQVDNERKAQLEILKLKIAKRNHAWTRRRSSS